jgi:hypothetical protein
VKKISLALVALVTLASAPYATACARGHCNQVVQAGNPPSSAVDPNAKTQPIEIPRNNDAVDPDAETVELPARKFFRSSEAEDLLVSLRFRGVATMTEGSHDSRFELAGLSARTSGSQDHNGEFILIGKPYDLAGIRLELAGDEVTGLEAQLLEGDRVVGDVRLDLISKVYGDREVPAASGGFQLDTGAQGHLFGKISVNVERRDAPHHDGMMAGF